MKAVEAEVLIRYLEGIFRLPAAAASQPRCVRSMHSGFAAAQITKKR